MIVTMDEMPISTNNIDDLTNYYKQQNVVIPDEWKMLARLNWPTYVMAAMGICWNESTRSYIVPSEGKLFGQFFVDLVLAKMVRYDFMRLYGDRKKKVIRHMDSAPVHTANYVVQWMKDHGVKWIPKLE